jgi:hypothetical protein
MVTRTNNKPVCLVFLIPMLLATSGCLDDLIRQFVPVQSADGEPGFQDASTDADLTIPEGLTITELEPNHGPFVGGTEVLISGSGFGGNDISIRIGGKAVQDVDIHVLSPISMIVITPAGEVGPADVEITRGSNSAKQLKGFTYDPIYLDPDAGPTVGGTLVTLQGKGTKFAAGMKLELNGKPMTDVEVVSATVLRAKTPPGIMGPADLSYSEEGSNKTIAGAFTYYAATDPKAGGMGGGPLVGTLTVSVLNWLNRQPVDGATVVVQKERKITLTELTDSKGVAVFADKLLTGPITVSAAKVDYESTTIVSFDARDLTIFLLPIPTPQPGPMPPGILAGVIKGFVLFGGTTGAGSSLWKLVPEPKQDQVKRAYVYTSLPSMDWSAPTAGASATIDYAADGKTAWPYTIVGWIGGLAVYAVAGLYHTKNESFEPYAMGVTRGIVVGPGETVRADVWVNIPLTRKVTVELKDVPKEVDKHTIKVAVDLGADGYIMAPQWEAQGDGVPSTLSFSRLPHFTHQGLADASFGIDVLLEKNSIDGLPYARARERSFFPDSGTFLIDEFVGVPQQVKPAIGGQLQGNTLAWTQTGAPHDLAVTTLRLPDGTPVWRVVSPGTTSEVKLPDPATFGLPDWPGPSAPLVWSHWLARLPEFDYNQFTYRHISSSYWDRWSFDEFSIQGP